MLLNFQLSSVNRFGVRSVQTFGWPGFCVFTLYYIRRKHNNLVSVYYPAANILALVTMGHTTVAASMAASMTMTVTASMHRVTVIRHISHIAVIVVGVVVDMLCPAVREQHSVRSLSHPCAIVRLVMAVVSSRVAVSHPIVEVVGNDL